jgi:hypothetical protein
MLPTTSFKAQKRVQGWAQLSPTASDTPASCEQLRAAYEAFDAATCLAQEDPAYLAMQRAKSDLKWKVQTGAQMSPEKTELHDHPIFSKWIRQVSSEEETQRFLAFYAEGQINAHGFTLSQAFDRILAVYGFEWTEGKISPTSDSPQNERQSFCDISRILITLKAAGLEEKAGKPFLQALRQVHLGFDGVMRISHWENILAGKTASR